MAINPKDMKRALANNSRLSGPVERLLLEKNSQKSSKRDTAHLHPSEICKKDWCPRSSYYRIMGFPEPPESLTFQKLNIFAEGNLIHEKWQQWLTEAGVMEQAEVPIFNEEHRIMGHADGVINDKKGRAVIEIKSIGLGTIRFEAYDLFAPYSKKEIDADQLWSSIKYPFPSHIKQAQLYMYCLGIDQGIILYEWKASQDVKEFSIQYQPELISPILASCLSVVRGLEAQTPPDRPTWLFPDHRVCKYCPFNKECWSENGSKDEVGGLLHEVQPSGQAGRGDTGDAQRARRVVRQPSDGALQ